MQVGLGFGHRIRVVRHGHSLPTVRPPWYPGRGNFFTGGLDVEDDDDVTYTRIIGPPGEPDAPAQPPRQQHPALIWRPKLGDEQVFSLENRIVRIGRHDENDIMLSGPTVSARHATVRREQVGVVIEDEGSLNGTFVNGRRVEQQLLEDGDQVQIGPHLLLYLPPASD